MSLKTDGSARHQFATAARLRDEGKFDEAIGILSELLSEHPDSPAILGTIAAVYYAAQRYSEARDSFKRVLALRPSAELASLGLFHSLWALGDFNSARAELVRFLSENDSQEYRDLMTDMGWSFDSTAKTLSGD